MDTTYTILKQAADAEDQAKHELDGDSFQHAAVWAQLATARSIAAVAVAAQAIADALNFHAMP